MTRKYDKRWLVDRITDLINRGYSRAGTAEVLCVSRSRVGEVMRDFGIRRTGLICPHCGVDIQDESALKG